MYYAEWLYARSRFLWYVAICVAIAGVFTYFVSFPPAGAHIRNEGQDVPIDYPLVFASVVTLIMASMMSATMNRDQSHLAYIWTKPIPRERIALSYILVDVATIVITYFAVFAIMAGVLAIPPLNHMIPEPDSWFVLARAVAVPLMVYAAVELATSWSPARLSAAMGLWWPTSIALLFLSQLRLPVGIAQIVTLVNFLNPLAYLPESHGHAVDIRIVDGAHPITLPFNEQTAVAYAIIVVALVVATYNWKRMEA